jgi:hypothetical protein
VRTAYVYVWLGWVEKVPLLAADNMISPVVKEISRLDGALCDEQSSSRRLAGKVRGVEDRPKVAFADPDQWYNRYWVSGHV